MDFPAIIEQATNYALKEIEAYGGLTVERFEIANRKGQDLAEKLWADKDIVLLWTIFMDMKIGQCIQEGNVHEHIQKSSQAAKTFLESFHIDEEIMTKIISCIDSHHGTDKYFCKEAEICANADCYRWLYPRGFLATVVMFGKEEADFGNVLTCVEEKIDEKYSALSLDICKQELESYYQEFKELITKSKI